MARKLFEKQGIRRRGGSLASGVTFVVYSDVGGTVLADISATSGGSAIAGSEITTADIAGLGPSALLFYGPPDDSDTLYLRCPADASLGVQEIEADEDERLDALEAGSSGIPGTIFDAKGDIIAASAADTAARLAVGANDTVLTADSTTGTGLKWAAGGGAHPDLATHDGLGLATDAELTTHAGAADPHTGYVLESAHTSAAHDTLGLVTDAILATHEADTTVVHGIADTALVMVREDLTQAVIDAKAVAGEALRLAAGTHTVATAITLRPSVPIFGDAIDQGGSLGTRIVGTAGQDVFVIDGDAVNYSGYHLENLKISGGLNQLHQTGTHSTYMTVRNVEFNGPSESCVLIDTGAIEEWYFDNVHHQGGEYGFRKISGGDLDNSNNYIDKSTFKDCLYGGQSKSGVHVDATFANTVTFLNPILNTTGEHPFYWRGGLRGLVVVNPNTEQCGQSGKKNRTTLTGTVSSGATSGTLASATGWTTGDQITIAGAGASGLDFEDTVTISGTTATWSTPTSTTVASPKVTNAEWDEFHFASIPAVTAPAQVTFIGGILASEGTLGRLRYSIRSPGARATLLGVSGGTGNDVPAYVPDPATLVALGGNLRVRTLLGREFDTDVYAERLPPITAPSAPSSGSKLYVDTADSKAKLINAAGDITVIG